MPINFNFDLGEKRRQQEKLAAWRPILGKLGAETAAEIGPLVTSNDPAAIQSGQSILANLLAQLDPQARANLANTRQAGEFAANAEARAAAGEVRAAAGEDRAAKLFPGQLEQQRLGNRGQQLSNELAGLQLDAARNPPPRTLGEELNQAWLQQTGAPVPSGYRVAVRSTPQGEFFPDIQPIESTDAYNKALEAVRGREEAVQLLDEFLDLMAEAGTEYTGKRAARMRQVRSRIIAQYAQLQNLGVLSPGELQFVSETLPDPTALGSNLWPAAAGNIAAGYDSLRNQTVQRLLNGEEQYWYIQRRPVLPEEQAGGR